MLQLDILIFDIDGVLIDVSGSFRQAIRQTVQLYLEVILGLPPCAGELVSPEEIAAIKLAGGFNNDWDLTTGILKYFIARLDQLPSAPGSLDNLSEIITFLRQAGQDSHVTIEELRRQKDLFSYADGLRAQGGGLAAARQVLGNRNDHLLWAEGDLRRTNLVKRIFEEVYLGERLFREEYGGAPLVDHGTGLIHRERIIASKSALAELSRHVRFGIATGRPRKQAVYTLETAGIFGLFDSLVAYEDIIAAEDTLYQKTGQRASLSKPHPFTLLQAAQRIMPERVRCAYMGDTPDDVRAANAAKAEMEFISIGCLAAAADKETLRREFERVGADVIVEHPDELKDLTGF